MLNLVLKGEFGLVQREEQFEISYDNIGFGWGIRYRTRHRNYLKTQRQESL